jgi:hypothetical protein
MTPEEYKSATLIEHSSDNGDSKVGFVYVPKTGGTYISINSIPHKYFGKKYRESGKPGDMHMPASRVIDIVGTSTPLFTMLREPYDRTCSEYYFIKNRTDVSVSHLNWDISDIKKIKFIAKRSGNIMNSMLYYEKTYNIYANNMSVEDYLEWSSHNPTYPFYFDVRSPKQFDAVGVTEEIDKTKMLLMSMYGMSSGKGEYNKNEKKSLGDPYHTKYPRSLFKKNNPSEYELYFEGKKKFEELCESYL